MENNFFEVIKLPVDEWQAYKMLRLEALQTEPQAFGSTYGDMVTKPDSFWQSRLEDAARGSGSWLLFAREKQALVGMIGAIVDEDDPRTATVISVYVTAGARGKKVSSALMHAILSELARRGVERARLSVNGKQLAAVGLYQRFGFSVKGIDPHQLMGSGEYVDELVMEKSLVDYSGQPAE